MSNEYDQHDDDEVQARLRATVLHLDAVLERVAERDERYWRDAPEAKALRLLRNRIVHEDSRSTPVEMADVVESVVRFLKLIEASSLGTPPTHRVRRLSSARDVATILTRADDLAVDLEKHLEREFADRLGISGNAVAPYRQRIKALAQDNVTEHDTDAGGEFATEGSRAAIEEPRVREFGGEGGSRSNGGPSQVAAGRTAITVTRAPDAELVRSATAGDSKAITNMLRVLEPMVVRYCLGRLGKGQDAGAEAEDCAQETLLVVLSAMPAYRDRPEGFLPFVFGIASNKVSDVYRRRARNQSVIAEPPVGRWTEADTSSGEDQRPAALDWPTGLLDTLTSRQREILILRIVLGLSAEETAATLGMSSAGAVRVAQHRALATLRSSLHAQKRTTC